MISTITREILFVVLFLFLLYNVHVNVYESQIRINVWTIKKKSSSKGRLLALPTNISLGCNV